MRIHHLDCGTMCPTAGKLVGFPRGPSGKCELVCHCLLIETDRGLVLVDAAMSTLDLAEPTTRLGRPFLSLVAPTLNPQQPALRQVEKLGFKREDVRHIVLTHLDVDHAGGIADFPEATVHVFETEHLVTTAPTFTEQQRYRSIVWSHTPRWSLHRVSRGEGWRGFDAVRDLDGLPPEILMIPLQGHTRGHCGIAVDTGSGWLLHAGDAYFFHGEIECPPRRSLALSLFERIDAIDPDSMLKNLERLQRLAREERDDLKVFCAHDRIELARMS